MIQIGHISGSIVSGARQKIENGNSTNGNWVNLAEEMRLLDFCAPQLRAAVNEATAKWGVRSVLEFGAANGLSMEQLAAGMGRINERSQWRYEQAMLAGFPPGWEKWQPPAERPLAPNGK